MQSIRLKTVTVTIVLCFLLVLSRLFYWQIIKYSDFKQRIIDQSYKASVIKPSRGQIFDQNYFPLALNNSLYSLSVYKPDLKVSPDEFIKNLNKVGSTLTPESLAQVEKFFQNDNQKWLTLKPLFDRHQTASLSDPGIKVISVEERFYPNKDLGKLFLGSTRLDNEGNLLPHGGLENYYQRQLSGKSGFSWETKDATGRTSLSKTGWRIDSVNGRDLVTTINRSIQFRVESTLREGLTRFSADSGAITVMDSDSGGIIAMAAFTASPSAESTGSATRNPVISNLFEPGSIFKPLVVAMALDSKSINDHFICTKCDRPHQIGEYAISNWDDAFHPDSTLRDIIKNSDNIGMSYIIDNLGIKNFLNYFNLLGLDRKTGIDLQGEVRPVIKSYWPEIDLATASFGQGFAITQIQMLTAFNALANNGLIVKPHFADKFIEADKQFPYLASPPHQVYSPEIINKIKEILKYSVENGVVAQFKPDNIEVCAKSGTSQIAVKGGYSESSTIASYIGFSPCQNPKFTMIVTINNPRSSPWGSSTAAPVWYDLAEFLTPLL